MHTNRYTMAYAALILALWGLGAFAQMELETPPDPRSSYDCDAENLWLFEEIEAAGWVGFGETWDFESCGFGRNIYFEGTRRVWRDMRPKDPFAANLRAAGFQRVRVDDSGLRLGCSSFQFSPQHSCCFMRGGAKKNHFGLRAPLAGARSRSIQKTPKGSTFLPDLRPNRRGERTNRPQQRQYRVEDISSKTQKED